MPTTGVLFLSLGRLVLLPGYASFCLKFAKTLLALPLPMAARVVNGGHTFRDQHPERRLRRRPGRPVGLIPVRNLTPWVIAVLSCVKPCRLRATSSTSLSFRRDTRADKGVA
jgi:hypothetical protein